MFIQKMQISVTLIIVAVTLHGSKTSMNLQELDSVGMVPGITVTAPRYEYQDEAWLGLIEEVVVEARRPSSSKNETVTGDETNVMVSGNISSKDMESTSIHFRNSVYLLILLMFTLVTLSIVLMSLRAYLAVKEAKHGRTKH
jgi:hypothetical protein